MEGRRPKVHRSWCDMSDDDEYETYWISEEPPLIGRRKKKARTTDTPPSG